MMKLEKQRMIAVDVSIIFTELILHQKRNNGFVLYQAKLFLEKDEKDREMDASVFLNKIRYFYEKCESYLYVYRDA